jgi:hypothetical protein
MAVLASIASGDFTDAATWGTVDATSYLNAEAAAESLLTTAYSASRSAAFTPGAITISHLGVKLCERIGTTGTMSVSLNNFTLGLDDFVTGTEVTIDVADLPAALETGLNGGWIFFKLASPVLLLAATQYKIQAKASTATMVDLWTDATADNLSRCLVTTTTAAPAAGDTLIVGGEYTGAGTSNTFTVTMNNTASTDFGAASTSLVTPTLAICSRGVLTWGVTASTAYYLKLSGNLIIYSDGVYNQGTVATPMTSSSTAHLQFDCAANVDFGITVRNGGTFIGQGAVKTTVWTYLNTDEAAAATVIGVASTSGWEANEVLCFASTTRTATQCEFKTISTVDSATQVTLTAGLTNAHSGTAPTRAEVGNLHRNVKITGASGSLQSYIDIKAEAIVDLDYVEIYWMGSVTANKRGIDIATTSAGSCNIQYCSLYTFSATSSVGIVLAAGTTTGVVISNNVFFNIATYHLNILATTGTHTVDNNLFMLNTTTSIDLVLLSDSGVTYTNNVHTGAVRNGLLFNEASSTLGTISGNICHSNGVGGMVLSSQNGIISDTILYRNNATAGLQVGEGANNLLFDGLDAFGNVTANILFLGCYEVTFNNANLNGDSTFATLSGVNFITANPFYGIYFTNSNFSTASGILVAHSTQDILPTTTAGTVYLENTILAATTEVAAAMNTVYGNSFISSMRHDQTAGLHKRWYKYGILTIDTTAGLYDVTPSVRITPNSASNKVEAMLFRAAVANGETAAVSVDVRESVVGDGTDYNGNRIRLIVKKNVAAGITADTVLATATASSQGAFETISGTTATVTGDCILEFAVDCDGTTGWVNIDTFTSPTATSTLGLQFWKDGVGYGYGNNSTGGGAGQVSYTYGG